jgi:DNA-binding response OmpR family regulator
MIENRISTDQLDQGKRRVLIVDGDVKLADLLKDVFDRDGRFHTRTANNGFDGGMQVKVFRPDLIVLDVMLPDINGKEVCQRIRRDERMDVIKILCISGMVEQDKISELIDAGADAFMEKPFTVESLLQKVCELLKIDLDDDALPLLVAC